MDRDDVIKRLKLHKEVVAYLVDTEEGRRLLDEIALSEAKLFDHLQALAAQGPREAQLGGEPKSYWQRFKAWFAKNKGSIVETLFNKINSLIAGALGGGGGKS